MENFSTILLGLDNVDKVQRIELFGSKGVEPAGVIQNQPGSSGSVKVFYHLYKTFGSISVDAATKGLSLYAEHTSDAKDNPGKHPNIDRLFNVIENNAPLTVKAIMG